VLYQLAVAIIFLSTLYL